MARNIRLFVRMMFLISGLMAGVLPSYANNQNLFNVSNVTVTSFSTLNGCGFSINSMFAGGPASTCGSEGGAKDVIFASQAPGSVDTVYFNTSSAVFVSSLKLFVNGDGAINGNYRDIGSFTFSYESAPGVWTVLATLTPSHPENGEYIINLSTPVTAQYFRAQFVQYGTGGPRIGTLEAFATPQVTPEPASVMLFGTGLVGVAARSLRRRKNSLGS